MLKPLFIFILLIPLVTGQALAYHIYETNSAHIEVNWIREPIIVTELNGIEIFIKTPDNAPISALEDKVTVQLQYKDNTIMISLDEDHENPARYVGWAMPMLEGNYNLNLSGEINGQLVQNQFKLGGITRY